MCNRCDSTTQEADLTEDLVVDGNIVLEALHGSHVFCLSSHVICNLNWKYTLLKFHIYKYFDQVIWSLVVNSDLQNTPTFILFYIYL